MPPLKDALCTNEFITGVASRTFWCLHRSSVSTYQQCPAPPTKEALAAMLCDQLAQLALMPNISPQ